MTKYTATDPETNSAYGATTGMCAFVRIIARAVDAAGPNPTREDLAAAVEGLGAIDTGRRRPRQLRARASSRPQRPVQDDVGTIRAAKDQRPFEAMCIVPEGERVPDPVLTAG